MGAGRGEKWTLTGSVVHLFLGLSALAIVALFYGRTVMERDTQTNTLVQKLQSLLREQKLEALTLLSPSTSPETQNKDSRFLIQPYLPQSSVSGPIKWTQLGKTIQDDFLLNGKVILKNHYFERVMETNRPLWPSSLISKMVGLAEARDPNVGSSLSHYGPVANKAFFEALSAYPVEGKSVLVVGSQHPWVEAICLGFKAGLVTTVDFNVPIVNYRGLRVLSLAQLDATNETFDAIFSYSSLEHDGLGRYGDPIHPRGDLERMRKMRGLIRDGGLLYLSVPNGNDTLVFNAHRIYGPLRFPLLIRGWDLKATYGSSLEETFELKNGFFKQPLHVLEARHRVA